MDFGRNGKRQGNMMQNNQDLPRIVKKLFKAKKERRRDLAKLPFEKKVEILLELQSFASFIRSLARRKGPTPWKI